MDGGGRVAQSLKRSSRPRRANVSAGQSRLNLGHEFFARFKRLFRRRLVTRHDGRLPRGLGIVAAMLFVIAAVAYGAIKGERVSDAIAHLKDGRDALANAAGFRVAQWSIAGRRQLTEQDVLSLAGVSDRTSLLFLDVEEARARLKASPWIAEAAVRKLYPAHLQVNIEEREPFALWQRDGKVFVIAGDGTVLAPLTDRRFATLPLVVGPGAEKKAREFLAVLDRYPELRKQVRAAILVGERRWNLKLVNGIDVRLPEVEIVQALGTLTTLDHDKKLLTRDITAVDLRLSDRISVRLSDTAAQAREDALKSKKPKKGGNA
jgi:cell division protein FtsQ